MNSRISANHPFAATRLAAARALFSGVVAVALGFSGAFSPAAAALLTVGTDGAYGGFSCADVAVGTGPKVQSWSCSGWENQQWTIQGSLYGDALMPRSTPGMCLDLVGGTGPLVQLAKCSGSQSQNWVFELGFLINQGSAECLDATSMNNGQQLKVNSCAVVASQTWQIK